MRIGFDGKRMTQNLTGLGNYSRYVVSLLARFYPGNNYTAYATKAPSPEMTITGAEYKYATQESIKSYWRSYGIIKNLKGDKIDLFHGLSNEIPFGLKKAGISSIVTVHDLIFLRYPQYYPLLDRTIYKLKLKYAISKSNRIIAISNQTKHDLIDYFDIQEDRIKVIYQNCDPIFHHRLGDNEKAGIREKYNLPKRYILNVGTIEERKNLMVVVKALKKLEDTFLVVVGKDTPYSYQVKDYVKKNNLTDRVHFLQNVTHRDLPGIYQSAKLFIYPSRFEGFGIPIVEALHSGIPVIGAKGSCLEEAGGPGSIYIDPDDEMALAIQINAIIESSQKRSTMIQAGYEYLKTFEDEKIAAEIMELYKKVLDHD